MMSFMLVFIFWLSWAPFIGLRLYEGFTDTIVENTTIQFGVVWIGILNSFWKIVIMCGMFEPFRLALRVFCLTICCKTKGRLQAELIGLDPDDWQ
jgi:dopamine/ecdysteroid receptor